MLMKGVWKSDLIMATWNVRTVLVAGKMREIGKETGRRKERLHLRWMDDVVADLKVMKIKQWMETMKEREKWRLIVEEAKGHRGMQHRQEGRKEGRKEGKGREGRKEAL